MVSFADCFDAMFEALNILKEADTEQDSPVRRAVRVLEDVLERAGFDVHKEE